MPGPKAGDVVNNISNIAGFALIPLWCGGNTVMAAAVFSLVSGGTGRLRLVGRPGSSAGLAVQGAISRRPTRPTHYNYP